MMHSFCEDEACSVSNEHSHKRKHKELMLLHGTRWENVPKICAYGLDPDCGHLSKGSWLGQNAVAAHAYAAKGPGPEQADGRRLFAIFLVACIPCLNEGDAERSFG